MSPEIVERVDAWTSDQRPALLVRGLWLVNDWRKACALWRYRRAKAPEDASGAVASAHAAMRGILLALVREAWGEPGMLHERCDGIWIARRPRGPVGLIEGPNGSAFFTEDEALVAALEAAPRREPSA